MFSISWYDADHLGQNIPGIFGDHVPTAGQGFNCGSPRYLGYLHYYYHWIDSTPRTGCGVMIGSDANNNPQGFFGLWREDIYPPITSAAHGSYKVSYSAPTYHYAFEGYSHYFHAFGGTIGAGSTVCGLYMHDNWPWGSSSDSVGSLH